MLRKMSLAKFKLVFVGVSLFLSWPLKNIAAEDAAKPQYGAWGFDIEGADFATRPGDDFFRYANGTWLAKTPIPPDKPAYSLRLAITDLTEKRLREILEAAGSDRSIEPANLQAKASAFYRAFMDESRADQLRAKPIAAQLDQISSARSRDALAALMGRTAIDFEHSLFLFAINVDLKDPDHYAFYLTQGGLGLPDRDYYLKPEFGAAKKAYEKYAVRLLELIGWPQPEKSARDILEFETKVAQASWTKTQQRDLEAIYNPMSVAELEKLAPGFAWRRFLTNAQMPSLSRLIVAEKSAFPKLANIYAQTPVGTIQVWHAFHVADNAAPYLSKPFTDAYFELHNRTLSGQKVQQARWKRAILAVSAEISVLDARSTA